MPSVDVICFETAAFYSLIEEVVARVGLKDADAQNEWISGTDAMNLLNIKSKTTLQTLRDTGKIKFSQPQKKIILYSRSSINEYLENNARQTF